MKKLVALSVLMFTFTCGTAQAAARTLKLEVNGMVCAFCAQGIEKKMRSLSQTKDVYVDLKNKIVAVELKDGQTLSHDLVKSLIKDAGYEVAKIDSVTESVQQLKAASRVKK